ncbi:PIN domain-containing protein [Phocaeicola sp. HCN-40430]|uniref:type II toxin-antitoxin system VapC family toxin n=1 Tax=Phocaeicola sp. HCN-40430 TaxID=3134664 RepID=UPI0030BE486A
MKIFCDTNIIMEFLFNRKEAIAIKEIFHWATQTRSTKYLSCGSIYTLTYLIERALKNSDIDTKERESKLRGILTRIVLDYSIIENLDWLKAIKDSCFSDIEDSYQYQAALSAKCDVLLTLNDRDFKQIKESNNLIVLTPSEFIDQFCKNN